MESLSVKIDKNKLYNVMGIARWGVEIGSSKVLLESLYKPSGEFIPLEVESGWYPVLFDVEKEGRYPTKEEWNCWIRDYIH